VAVIPLDVAVAVPAYLSILINIVHN